jgi:hypothetical protein
MEGTKYRVCISSSVSIVSGYGLDDRTIEVRSPAGAKNFPVASVSRPALGPTQPGRDADHSPLSSAEVQNE